MRIIKKITQSQNQSKRLHLCERRVILRCIGRTSDESPSVDLVMKGKADRGSNPLRSSIESLRTTRQYVLSVPASGIFQGWVLLGIYELLFGLTIRVSRARSHYGRRRGSQAHVPMLTKRYRTVHG
jgi:hypothetical protein